MNAKEIKQEYLDFISQNAIFGEISETQTDVVTPYVDPYGEAIGFTIKHDGRFFTITDLGYTAWNLSVNGIDIIKKGRRRSLLDSLLQYNGFDLNTDEHICRTVTKKNLGQAIHDMTQLLINVYDFALLHPHSIRSQFLDDVKDYFMNNEHFTVFPAFSIAGRSRLEHRFNFVFMSKGLSKIVRVHNSITKQQVDNILAGWLDTVEYRKREYGNKEKLYIIVSPEGFEKIHDDHFIALQEYGIEVLNFNNKSQLIEQLGA